ncbi:MAG: S41 family peptidase [Micavibrio sp.]
MSSFRKYLTTSSIALSLAFTVLAASTCGASNKEPSASSTDDTKSAPAQTLSPEQKYQDFLTRYKDLPLQGADYEAVLKSDKFKTVLEYLLENSVRNDLTAANLKAAAKAALNAYDEKLKSGEVKEAKTEQTILTVALNGMMSYASPHDDYFPPREAAEFQQNMSGQFGGLGFQFAPTESADGNIIVEETVEDGPAQRAGVRKGDIITGVNGTSFLGKKQNEVIELLRGEPGSNAVLDIKRDGQNMKISVTREIIKAKQVAYKMLEGGVAHITLARFDTNASMEIKHAIAKAKADALINPQTRGNGGLRGVILDLRFNPGGLLEEARRIVDDFIDKEGLVASTVGRKPEFGDRETSVKGDILGGLPLAVLVNEASASASEVVAGALQDHQRATIIGSDTFGKGTVQTTNPAVLKDGSIVKATIAIYRRPAGTSPQFVGVHPDVKVISKDTEYNEYINNLVREKDRPRAIPNPKGVAAEQFRTKSVCTPTDQAASLTPANSTDKNVFTRAGKVDPFVACARDHLLQQQNASFRSALTITSTVQHSPAPTQ